MNLQTATNQKKMQTKIFKLQSWAQVCTTSSQTHSKAAAWLSAQITQITVLTEERVVFEEPSNSPI